MDTVEAQITLDHFAVGSRLIVRARQDWRFAAISKVADERVTLTVCSPSGRTYRLSRDRNCEIYMEGQIPIVLCDEPDDWRENLGRYDIRW
ncbi:MAG TPA: hypothetical protein VNA17_06230 [Pyrinomonadaceae bacterium]|nr:hypothetical protein [Pyrinomonadaceae bacterium]